MTPRPTHADCPHCGQRMERADLGVGLGTRADQFFCTNGDCPETTAPAYHWIADVDGEHDEREVWRLVEV